MKRSLGTYKPSQIKSIHKNLVKKIIWTFVVRDHYSNRTTYAITYAFKNDHFV